MDPQPPEGVAESTGTDFAGRVSRGAGVEVPGVEGGVKAGETRPGRESVRVPSDGWEEESSGDSSCDVIWLCTVL